MEAKELLLVEEIWGRESRVRAGGDGGESAERDEITNDLKHLL